VGARQQQTFAPAGAEQQPRFAGGQPEHVGDDVDGLRRLAEQDLRGGVGDDHLAEVGTEQVTHVLGDDRQPGPALASRLREPGQELRAFAVPEQRPRLVDEDQPAGRIRRPHRRCVHITPDSVEREQHAGRPELVGEVAGGPGHHLPLRNGGGRAVEHLPERPGGPRGQPCGEGFGRLTALLGQGSGHVTHEWRLSPPGGRVVGDPRGVVRGVDRLVQRGPLRRRRLLS